MNQFLSRSRRMLSLLLTVVAAGLVLAACDSGPSVDTADGIIAPVNSEVSFRVQPDSAQSDTLTLEYRDLSERPRPDTASLPGVYSVEVGEETGTPKDGSSTFLVTFMGPRDSGSYAAPIRFRAGKVTATVRFAGTVIGPQPLFDFETGTEGFFAFSGPSISQESGQLVIEGTNLGGSGNFPGIVKPFSAPVNFADTPVIEMRARVTAQSDTAIIRAALNGAGDNPDANVTVPELVAEVPGNQGYATYYFDFRGNFEQFDGAPVDPTQIGEFVLLFNDNNPNTFTGTIYIDEILRRPTIPEDDG